MSYKIDNIEQNFEYQLQINRINTILDNTIKKIKFLVYLPTLLEDDGQILRQHFEKSEVDYILLLFDNGSNFSPKMLENRSDLCLIYNKLTKTNNYALQTEKSLNQDINSENSLYIHIAYALNLILASKSLALQMESMEENIEPNNAVVYIFIDAIIKLKKIVSDKLAISPLDEIQRENDLKMAYRSGLILSQNIEELEQQLEKQRQELDSEQDRKEAVLSDLTEKINLLHEKTKLKIKDTVYDSELKMMKDYLQSSEKQKQLSDNAKKITEQYDNLLKTNLIEENILRSKRLKVEAQLANWINKYDTDIGERQTELDKLEKKFQVEEKELTLLEQTFENQEREYLILMREKENEEKRIREEKAWIYLQNRAATRIQKYWRAYRIRKLAKKKGKKSKKEAKKEK